MRNFFLLLLCLFVGILSHHYAKQRGRNPRLWFIAGFLFGLLGLLVLLLLPSKKRPLPQTANAPQVNPISSQQPLIEALDPAHVSKLWYYLDVTDQQFGPMSLHALSNAWKEGKVHARTYVWNEELVQWQHFEQVLKPCAHPI